MPTPPTAATFTAPVQVRIAEAKARLAGKRYSDLQDAAGHQYVDLVMGGGGVLGIALVGYTYALEQLGLRFLSIGGTSAGSINALVLAAFGKPEEAKSERMLPLLAAIPMWDFVDGPHAAKSLIRDFLGGGGWGSKTWHAVRELPDFLGHLGLNPGDAFRDWLAGILKDAGITTTAQLEKNFRLPPGLVNVDNGDVAGVGATLGLVATDISTETKAVFPRMAPLYWEKAHEVNPALYARASMSIPFFFHPLRVNDVPSGPAARKRWVDEMKFDRFEHIPEFPPKEVAFVDGGVLSNFPIDMFHNPNRVPRAPTFGVKLGTDRPPIPHFDAPLQYVKAVFDAARHAADHDFIERNPDFVQLVATVDTGKANWLDFDMKPAAMAELFACGVDAALEFLDGFWWEKYKDTRRGVKEATRNAAEVQRSKE